jgi:uncharacterized protein
MTPPLGGQPPTAGWYQAGTADAARAAREQARRRRARAALGVSIGITLTWLVFVTLAGHWPRVRANWVATLTMVFGSFVAGSTPQGGGAVAFPVFTKVLAVPSDVARTFSLCIQTVGMGTAALSILINQRLVEVRAVLIGGTAAAVGFLTTLFVLGSPSEPFWPARVPGPYVRVTFTLVLAAMAFVVYLGTRVRIRKVDRRLPPMNARLRGGVVLAGLLGGVASALVGSGADVLIYLFVVVLFGLDPKVGVPTSVLVMAFISVLGFAVLGIGHGQLDVLLSPDGCWPRRCRPRATTCTASGWPRCPSSAGARRWGHGSPTGCRRGGCCSSSSSWRPRSS